MPQTPLSRIHIACDGGPQVGAVSDPFQCIFQVYALVACEHPLRVPRLHPAADEPETSVLALSQNDVLPNVRRRFGQDGQGDMAKMVLPAFWMAVGVRTCPPQDDAMVRFPAADREPVSR